MTPDTAPAFQSLPSPLTPRLLAVREQAFADLDATEQQAAMSWPSRMVADYRARNGAYSLTDEAEAQYRRILAWVLDGAPSGLHAPKGGNE